MLTPSSRALATILFVILGSRYTLIPAYSQTFSTILNIPTDANIGDGQSIGSDTQLNLLAGGTIGQFFAAGASAGSSTNVEVNISGGSVGRFFNANASSTINISGGTVGGLFEANAGSTVNFSGGSLGDVFRANNNSAVTISGGEFRMNGAPVSGPINLPQDALLSGTLADGTPFAFAFEDNDFFANNVLTLLTTSLPNLGPLAIRASIDPVPQGIRQGQTLRVDDGSTIAENFNAGLGSTVSLETGGTIGNNFEAVGAQVNLAGGTITGGFDAFNGTTVNLSAGSAGDNFNAHAGSTVNILGGSVGSGFETKAGSTTNISGGALGDSFNALEGSTLHLFVTQFELDGVDLTSSLSLLTPAEINSRDTTLSGLLADGSPFSLDLNSTIAPQEDFVDANATLILTRVLPGDFNNDGTVNAADLPTWQTAFGTTVSAPFTGGDSDGDRDVDGSDLLGWQRQVSGNSADASLTSIPEPTSLALAAAMLSLLASRRNCHV